MITFIDADSLMFKVAHRSRTEHDLRKGWREKIKDIGVVTWADQVIVGVKGAHKNFRYDILEDYKGTRPSLDQVMKNKLNYLHKFAVKEGAIRAREGWETDDEIAQWAQDAYADGDDYTIAHIDKDLDLIVGSHYNYNKDTHYEVTHDEALYNFYHQLLTGDRSDNIPGIRGIGPVRATKLLSEGVYYDTVAGQWKDHAAMERSARCLFMGDPELFTWDLRKLYAKEETETNVETVHQLLEDSPAVLCGDDEQDGDEPDELLRQQRNRDELDGPTESNNGTVREEVGVPTDGTAASTTL